MLNLVERRPWKRQDTESLRATSGTQATTALLRDLFSHCAACEGPLDGHTYRFFSCHPAGRSGAEAFLAAVDDGDWATVHAAQLPAIGQAMLVVYAVACPGLSQGGMVAMLLVDEAADAIAGGGASSPARLQRKQALSPEEFANLRALCPTCQWIPFGPALQSGQETV